jgi:hypothetical protein
MDARSRTPCKAPRCWTRASNSPERLSKAAYAAKDPPIVRRLASERVPYLMDLPSLRFAGEGYLDVQDIVNLDFAPRSPLRASEIDAVAARALAEPCLRFTHRAGAAAYTIPGLPPVRQRASDVDRRQPAHRRSSLRTQRDE